MHTGAESHRLPLVLLKPVYICFQTNELSLKIIICSVDKIIEMSFFGKKNVFSKLII